LEGGDMRLAEVAKSSEIVSFGVTYVHSKMRGKVIAQRKHAGAWRLKLQGF